MFQAPESRWLQRFSGACFAYKSYCVIIVLCLQGLVLLPDGHCADPAESGILLDSGFIVKIKFYRSIGFHAV